MLTMTAPSLIDANGKRQPKLPARRKLVAASSAFATIMLLSALLLFGSRLDPEAPPKSSTDITALRNLVVLDMPITSARWEIFNSPEDVGLLPTSPDVISLIAEIELSDPGWFQEDSNPRDVVSVMPESARPWLSASFTKIVKLEAILTAVSLPDGVRCKKYGTLNKKLKEPVDGFICARKGRLLLYLTLRSYT